MADTPNVKLTKLDAITSNTQICDDFYMGALEVLTELYLPKWTGETQAGYDKRIASTAFANMFSPVVDGLAGMVMKKEPTIEGYEHLDNIDLKNNTLQNFIKQSIKKSIVNGVDFISAETNKEQNRAYLKRYSYADLYSYVIEDSVLKQIVFIERVEVQDGAFGLKEQERYVVFTIGGGSVWYAEGQEKEVSKKSEWENSLKEIPVLPIVTGKVLSDFEYIPKLLDIAILNKVHLNLESNLANVLGVVGNPVPVFYGILGDDKKTIGVKDALVFTDRKTEGFEWVEVQGQSVGTLKEKIGEVEAQIDKLTFSMLLNNDSKTVIDAQSKQSKNTSFLSDIAFEAEAKFKKILQFMAELENKTITEDARFEMEKEFDLTVINLETAFKALQAGDMSRTTYYEIMRTGKLPNDFDVENEALLIEQNK